MTIKHNQTLGIATTALLGLGAALASAPVATAQEKQDDNDDVVLRPDLWKATELMEQKVVNRDGKSIGEITDVVLGLRGGLTRYAVVENGERFAIRLDRFRLKSDGDDGWTFVLDFDQATVDRTPKLKSEKWPTMVPDIGSLKEDPMVRKASDVVGMEVENWLGEDLGEIEDIVIDCNDRYVSYAVLEVPTGFLNLSERYFAIPLHRTRFDKGDDVLRLAADPSDFTDAPTAEVTGYVELEDGMLGDTDLYWVDMNTNDAVDTDYLMVDVDPEPYRVVDVWWLAWSDDDQDNKQSEKSSGKDKAKKDKNGSWNDASGSDESKG